MTQQQLTKLDKGEYEEDEELSAVSEMASQPSDISETAQIIMGSIGRSLDKKNPNTIKPGTLIPSKESIRGANRYPFSTDADELPNWDKNRPPPNVKVKKDGEVFSPVIELERGEKKVGSENRNSSSKVSMMDLIKAKTKVQEQKNGGNGGILNTANVSPAKAKPAGDLEEPMKSRNGAAVKKPHTNSQASSSIGSASFQSSNSGASQSRKKTSVAATGGLLAQRMATLKSQTNVDGGKSKNGGGGGSAVAAGAQTDNKTNQEHGSQNKSKKSKSMYEEIDEISRLSEDKASSSSSADNGSEESTKPQQGNGGGGGGGGNNTSNNRQENNRQGTNNNGFSTDQQSANLEKEKRYRLWTKLQCLSEAHGIPIPSHINEHSNLAILDYYVDIFREEIYMKNANAMVTRNIDRGLGLARIATTGFSKYINGDTLVGEMEQTLKEYPAITNQMAKQFVPSYSPSSNAIPWKLIAISITMAFFMSLQWQKLLPFIFGLFQGQQAKPKINVDTTHINRAKRGRNKPVPTPSPPNGTATVAAGVAPHTIPPQQYPPPVNGAIPNAMQVPPTYNAVPVATTVPSGFPPQGWDTNQWSSNNPNFSYQGGGITVPQPQQPPPQTFYPTVPMIPPNTNIPPSLPSSTASSSPPLPPSQPARKSPKEPFSRVSDVAPQSPESRFSSYSATPTPNASQETPSSSSSSTEVTPTAPVQAPHQEPETPQFTTTVGGVFQYTSQTPVPVQPPKNRKKKVLV